MECLVSLFCHCWNHLQPKAIWEKQYKLNRSMKFTVILAFSWKVHVNGLFAVDKPNKETKLTNCYSKRYKKKY